jgi:hypothetical protein
MSEDELSDEEFREAIASFKLFFDAGYPVTPESTMWHMTRQRRSDLKEVPDGG